VSLIQRKVFLGAFAIFGAFAIIILAERSPAQGLGQELPNPYRAVENWLRMPEGQWLGGGTYATGVDSHGNVWILTRCGLSSCGDSNEPALLQFDSSGKFVKGIGRGLFAVPHGLFIDQEDNLWVADDGIAGGRGNQVTKLSPDGRVLLTLGKKGVMGGGPENFIGPSDVLIAPNGDIFVADGHAVMPTGGGQSLGYDPRVSDPTHMRVAKFSKDGKFIKAWGKFGTGPGEFNVPHGLAMDSQGRLFVADRGNNRIQIFDQDGKFLDEWKQFGKPVSVFIDSHDTLYAIDSDSIANVTDWKYSSIGNSCAGCLVRTPRLTDVGLDSPDFTQGIRIGSAKDGVVRAFIPTLVGPNGPTNLPEYMSVDPKGNLYVAASRTEKILRYVKKVELAEGPGKENVQRACSSCHDFDEFPRVNFDREDWAVAVNTMVGAGAPLTKDEIPGVVDYLAKNFRGVDTPGKQVPGSVQATITEWDVPTPNSMPYGIYHSKVNGFTWYTGLFSNIVGRFDPKSQHFKEYHLRAGTNPVSLVEFPTVNFIGTAYFVPQTGGFVGRFHPVDGPYPRWKEGDVVEQPIPGPDLRFRQAALSKSNVHLLWFTATEAIPQLFHPEGSKIGSLRPWTQEVKLLDTPTPNASPYGIAVNSMDVPYFTELNNAQLGSVNPHTMQMTEYPLPDPESGPRGIAVGVDDVVWYTDYLRGYLGRFDPKTGEFKEWPSPSGPRSRPWGITTVGNVVWYAEAGTKPNMLVRFDPKTEKFQSWPVKAGGGIRQIFSDADGSLWFTRPLANGIAHVTIEEQSPATAAGK
jgi:virginiamycin B lyase